MREHLEAISVCLAAIEGQLRDRKVTSSRTQWHRCQNIEELKQNEGWTISRPLSVPFLFRAVNLTDKLARLTISQCDTFSLRPGVLSITLKQETHPNPNPSYVTETPKTKTMQFDPQLSAHTRTQLLFDMRPLVMFPNCH